MAILDRTACVVAERHSGSTSVTASVDAMHFLAPAEEGDILIFRASVNRTWRTSMEIGVKVLSEHYRTGQIRHILSAYFTFVAVDSNRKPTPVPPIVPKTPIEKRRFMEAEDRRQQRKRVAAERAKKRQEFPLQ